MIIGNEAPKTMKPEVVNIKVSCMSLMWGKFNMRSFEAAEWLDDIAEAGFEGGGLHYSELIRFMDELDFPSLLRERNLSIAAVYYLADPDLTQLRETCELMRELGAHHLVTGGGVATRDANPADVARVLDQIGETALEYGVRAGYHNHTNQTGETLEETEELLKLTHQDFVFGFLDTGHATKDFAGHPLGERASIFLERNWSRMDYIELKDWSEEHDLSTDVGSGRCNFDSVFEILNQRTYSGWIGVEQNAPMGDKTPLQSARSSRDFIRARLGV